MVGTKAQALPAPSLGEGQGKPAAEGSAFTLMYATYQIILITQEVDWQIILDKNENRVNCLRIYKYFKGARQRVDSKLVLPQGYSAQEARGWGR